MQGSDLLTARGCKFCELKLATRGKFKIDLGVVGLIYAENILTQPHLALLLQPKANAT